VAREAAQTRDGIEIGVARIEREGRRVIDIEQNRVDVARHRVNRARLAPHDGEEVGVHESCARVIHQSAAHREQPTVVPADDFGQGIDDRERADARVVEGGHGRVAEPEPADDDAERPLAGHGSQPEPGEFFFSNREKARHEVLIAELHFEDVGVDDGLVTSTQRELAHGRLLMGELVEAEHQAMRIIFLLTNSSMPRVPSSRPEPERLMPPKGSSGLSASTQLT